MSSVCPICSAPLALNPRYPDYVCDTCAAHATDANGRPLAFCNESMSGGFIAQYADTGEPYNSQACWINGIPCHAAEHRFGGIVIEVIA